MICTARSRRLIVQNAQLPSHRWPRSNARGMTVSSRIDLKTGPCVPPSYVLATATAS